MVATKTYMESRSCAVIMNTGTNQNTLHAHRSPCRELPASNHTPAVSCHPSLRSQEQAVSIVVPPSVAAITRALTLKGPWVKGPLGSARIRDRPRPGSLYCHERDGSTVICGRTLSCQSCLLQVHAYSLSTLIIYIVPLFR
jgi:hypothetical protein